MLTEIVDANIKRGETPRAETGEEASAAARLTCCVALAVIIRALGADERLKQ